MENIGAKSWGPALPHLLAPVVGLKLNESYINKMDQSMGHGYFTLSG